MTWLTLRLTAQDGSSTRLELEHASPIASIPADTWDTYGPGATGIGWDSALLGLALHLGTQDAQLAPAEAAEWALTPEGISFTRAASQRWAEAHIAAGADPDTAARAAAACAAFYTGQPAAE